MGIQGLWQVLEPAGRPINVNSLRGKVLAVDVSIWLHQLVKGFRDKDGNPLPNAHLIGVFHRVCKLLHYGIKPVFVFDGGVPILKRQTLALRRKRKIEALDKSEESRQKLLSNFIKQQLQRQIKKALPPTMRMEAQIAALSSSSSPTKSRTPSPKKKVREGAGTSSSSKAGEDVFETELQAFRDKFAARVADDGERMVGKEDGEESSESTDDEDDYGRSYGMDYSDNFSAIVSSDFDTLPLETQHEILFEMQESRKMNSWGKMEQMPQSLQDFSSYQMDRLVKRRFLQKKIQSVQTEMGQRHIHVQNLDELLKMDYNFDSEVVGSQEKGCLLVKKKSQEEKVKDEKPGSSSGIKQSTEVITIDDYVQDGWSSEDDDVKIEEKPFIEESSSTEVNLESDKTSVSKSKSELEEDKQLAMAIKMSLIEAKIPQKSQLASPSKSVDNKDIGKLVNVLDATGPAFVSALSESTEGKEDVEEGSNSKFASGVSFMNSLESSQISSCSKFLDTVGFSSKIHSAKSLSPQKKSVPNVVEKNDSSESESDFEAVESEDASQEVDERKLVSKLLENTLLNEESISTANSSSIATITLSDVISKAPENDIFADIFGNKEDSEDATSNSLQKEKEVDNAVSNDVIDNEDANWDSDPEVDLISELETTQNSKNVNTENGVAEADVRPAVVNLSQEEFLHKFNRGNESNSKESNTPGPSSNQKIARTLGRLPFQTENNGGLKMITAEYMQAQDKLNTEQDKLKTARGFQERVATSISDQMSVETQELISLFGIPYVISPMEAESQCAFLDIACLTEGTITDDSDVWLFGGQRVYKNFYSSGNRHLEFYQQADIIKVLNLDRDKLVLMAMLMGGDYSEGIEGVGPVTALELLSEFPTNSIVPFDILVKLREWWDDAQNQKSVDAIAESKVKAKLRNLKLKAGFPNKSVYEAYMSPSIDTSTESFRWGNPDLDAIRTYTKSKFGWDQTKCDGMLLPVLKEIQCQADKSKQLTLDAFLTSNKYSLEKPFKRKKGSKRLHIAVKKLKSTLPTNELNLSSESSSDDSNDEKVESPQKIPLIKKTSNKKKAQSSPSKPQSNCTTNIVLPKKNPIILQKVQEETQRKLNKQKAIDVLKNKKVSK